MQFKLLLKDLRQRDLRSLYLREATNLLAMLKCPRTRVNRSTNRPKPRRNRVTNLKIFGDLLRRTDL